MVQAVHFKPDWRESFCLGRPARWSKTWTKSGATGTETPLSVHFQEKNHKGHKECKDIRKVCNSLCKPSVSSVVIINPDHD